MLLFVLLFSFLKMSSQDYCIPIHSQNNNSFTITNVIFGNINNTSTKHAENYTYYNELTTTVNKSSTYPITVKFNAKKHNTVSLKVWIDFNGDGIYNTSNEEVYTSLNFNSETTKNTHNFSVTIPNNTTLGVTRMRVALKHNTEVIPCSFDYQQGEMEEYPIIINPVNEPPIANCIKNLSISLNPLGIATISPSHINDGSSDAIDNLEDLILTIDKSTFTCNDLNKTNIVTLTVEDTDGLTSSCSTEVTLLPYSGNFTAPVLNNISKFCSYTAPAPIMNYSCQQKITGTTNDPTYFSTPGTYTISWSFNNGSNTVTSTQTIHILQPATPTNISFADIQETTATVSWNAPIESPSFKIRYKAKNTNNWIEDLTNKTSYNFTNLDNGTEYEVQIKINDSCTPYTVSNKFETIAIEYCTENTHILKDKKYHISNVTIGTINNNSDKNASVYTHYPTTTSFEQNSTFSGTINYKRTAYNTTAISVWIDFNNDGDFDDANETIFSKIQDGTSATDISVSLENIQIPTTPFTGKTRMRIALTHTSQPNSACEFNYAKGEIEDYDIYLTKNLLSAIFTQTYHYGTSERWIEITNTDPLKTINANTLSLALYSNTSGDQTGKTPNNTFTIDQDIPANTTLLIRKPTATINNYEGNTISTTSVTKFNNANDILIITHSTDTDAWTNRLDVLTNIPNNSSMVRIDEKLNHTTPFFNSNEWVVFVDDNLDPYKDNTPERHPHAPVLNEVKNAVSTQNSKLGVYKKGATIRTNNNWSNGTPDRSRHLIINENYIHSNAQLSARKLTVTNNSKLTIVNNLLIVNDTITLTNSLDEIRLSGTSQMIQTHQNGAKITGLGKLYIDRISGQTSKYRYNYFSSPVNTIGNNNYAIKDVLKDGSIPTSENSSPPNIQFISGYNGNSSSPISIAEHWIFTYATNSDWTQKKSNGIINQTDGFTLKGPGKAQNYTFVGTPKDGNITTNIKSREPYLIGNPYTSSINAKKFIEDNSNAIDGTLYFWQHTDEKKPNDSPNSGHNYSGYIGGYGVRNIAMGIAANQVVINNNSTQGVPSIGNGIYKEPTPYIPVGQGFFVVGDADGGTISFKNSQREFISEGTNAVFFKSQHKKTTHSPLATIKIGLNYTENSTKMHKQIGISFKNGNSFDNDQGYDSPIFIPNKTDIYWEFPNDSLKYAIAGVQNISETLKVPLTIKAENKGTFTLQIDEWQNINENVFILDKQTNTTHKINNSVFHLELEKGLHLDRFYLTFSNAVLSTPQITTEDILKIYYYRGTVTLNNFNNLEIYKVQLINLLGQVSQTWQNLSNESTLYLNTISTAQGIHLLRIKTSKGVLTKKIVL